jgi:beta-glucosidase
LLAKEHLQYARQLATQSVVLLKNKDGLLPLDREKVKTIAVIGPLADDKNAQLGAWALDGIEADCRTPLEAIKESAGADTEIIHAPGLASDLDLNTSGFNDAVAAARKSDVVVLIVGEGAKLSGEAHSRAILNLPGAQEELVDAVAAVGKPIVLVIQAGRPLTIGRQIEHARSVLYSFHAGTMAGPAIADLLWGAESPSAKLPVTFPRSVGQEPLYYNHANTGRPPRPYKSDPALDVNAPFTPELNNTSSYLDVGPYPLFPFGYGLSYTTFEYSPAELSGKTLTAATPLEIRLKVINTGGIPADEIVQFYIRRVAGSIVPPVRELKGFRRVRLNAGESKLVAFSLTAEDLSYFNNKEQRTTEPGRVELFVGGSSLAPLVGEVELVQ